MDWYYFMMKYLDFVITLRGILNMEIGNLNVSKEGLEQFKLILEDWIPKDASLAIALDNTYIYYCPSIHHIHLKTGESVHPESIAAQVLKHRKKTELILDTSTLGAPYYTMGYPITIDQQNAALIIILPSTYFPERQQPYKFLTGKGDEDWTPIPIKQISYIESLQKKTWFYTDNEQYKSNMTLKELQTKLPEYFLRIHRSYILNIYYIKKISRDLSSNFVVELKTGTELPVSQSYIHDLRRALEF